ncbi:MAG TPA: hypothetical protein VD867_02735 [Burkholderiales bacterium]|nr:hypothetical protein [Burkholderiales bacterium]
MTTTAGPSVWDTFEHTPSPKQRVFLRYLTATLVDLVVLGLFAEYWDYVAVDSFTIMLLAAVVLQVLLKVTIVIEHKVAAFFNARPGGFNKFMRFFAAWVVLFGSKFVILEALVLAFGDQISFGGPFHGIVALIVVVVVMLVVEAVMVKFYRSLD